MDSPLETGAGAVAAGRELRRHPLRRLSLEPWGGCGRRRGNEPLFRMRIREIP